MCFHSSLQKDKLENSKTNPSETETDSKITHSPHIHTHLQYYLCTSTHIWIKRLTRRCGFTDKRDEFLFDFSERIKVVHEEHVPLAGFAGDAYQLSIVGVGKTDGKHDVTWSYLGTLLSQKLEICQLHCRKTIILHFQIHTIGLK